VLFGGGGNSDLPDSPRSYSSRGELPQRFSQSVLRREVLLRIIQKWRNPGYNECVKGSCLECTELAIVSQISMPILSSIRQLPRFHDFGDSKWLPTTTIVTATN